MPIAFNLDDKSLTNFQSMVDPSAAAVVLLDSAAEPAEQLDAEAADNEGAPDA